ncbi:MAG: S8 family serine peptidase [Simkaniaceae bacterium]|nr:S8 family serine peptidase [Simkaniaceae bacterium]
MKRIALLFLLSFGLNYANTMVSPSVYTLGQRGENLYRVWIYFDSKDESQTISLNDKALSRRSRAGVSDHRWEDIPVNPNYISALEKIGLDIIHQSRWLNAISAYATQEQLDQLALLPNIKKIRPVLQYRRDKQIATDRSSSPVSARADTSFYGYSWDQIEQIQVNTAHDNEYFGHGVRILVMDTGFWLEHRAFDRLNLIAQWDVINDDSVCANETAYEFYNGQDNHGTMVLSAMAAYWPDTLIGPAYAAEYLLAKTEDVTQEVKAEEDNYVAGLEWGEARGADVVSTSLGYLDWYSYCDMDGATAVTTRAVDIAAGLGVVCVTAMGNEGYYSPPQDLCNDPLTYYMIAPADADSVIAVGAVNQYGGIAGFSSRGPTYDGRIKPEVCARGYNTYCVLPYSDDLTYASGTSLATPLVGGAAAVILSAHPDWDAMTVREAMMMTATRSDRPDNDYGWGIVQTWDAIQYLPTQNVVIPDSYAITSVYPNPFNATVSIYLNSPDNEEITLGIYDLNGRLVTELFKGRVMQGTKKLSWNANEISSGIYIIKMQWADGSNMRKLTLIK